ncbi:MAG: replication-associated recombination protein A [Phycisphaerales bacterium]
MADLWQDRRDRALAGALPLAARMRPRSLDEFVGQAHILGEGRLLRRMLQAGRLTSVILHGPPGTGKTTLAEVVAKQVDATFERENAASVGVQRIRQIIDDARARLADSGRRTVLFLDEIHRFTRAQQDVLLADVERGVIILIGATTENPMFTVNSALVSRSTVFRLESLDEAALDALLRRAIADSERGYGRMDLQVDDDAIAHWARIADGDARRALSALEVAVASAPQQDGSVRITLADAQESIQRKAMVYDRQGDQHYDHASALIKSVRGSDPDAALYWVARMLESGEDPRFICRRLAILASEDIGNADPRAVMVAEACWSLVERIGMPEARITIGQCVVYLALAPKSNASYVAIDAALADVREGRTIPVPLHLRDPNKVESAGSAAEGKGYEYAHNARTRTSVGGVTEQAYLGVEKTYYEPSAQGYEAKMREILAEIRAIRGPGKA